MEFLSNLSSFVVNTAAIIWVVAELLVYKKERNKLKECFEDANVELEGFRVSYIFSIAKRVAFFIVEFRRYLVPPCTNRAK